MAQDTDKTVETKSKYDTRWLPARYKFVSDIDDTVYDPKKLFEYISAYAKELKAFGSPFKEKGLEIQEEFLDDAIKDCEKSESTPRVVFLILLRYMDLQNTAPQRQHILNVFDAQTGSRGTMHEFLEKGLHLGRDAVELTTLANMELWKLEKVIQSTIVPTININDF